MGRRYDNLAPFLREATPNGRAVLLWLWTYASFGDDEATAWPAAVTIADLLGMNERSVRRRLEELVAIGAISRVRRQGRKVWLLDPGPDTHARTGHPRPDRTPTPGSSGETGHPRPDRTPTPGPDTHATKPGARAQANRAPAPTEVPVNTQQEGPQAANTADAVLTHPTPEPKRKSKPKACTSAESLALAQYLYDAIRSHDPEYLAGQTPAAIERKLNGWAVHLDRLVRIDGATPESVRRVIDYVHRGPREFWRSNILGGAKLRKQYDRLRIEANGRNGQANNAPNLSGLTPEDFEEIVGQR